MLSACKKDPTMGGDGTNPLFQTTPYPIQIPSSLPPSNLPTDNPLTVEGVELGRMLFYDPILSLDSTMSCASCHNQAFAFTDNGDALSEGVSGLEGLRNSMPIFNLQFHTHGFLWDGRSDLLRHQSLEPIEDPLELAESLIEVLNKLNGSGMYKEGFANAFNIETIEAEHLSLALEQFMNSIISGQSKFDLSSRGGPALTSSEQRGRAIFFAEAVPNDSNNNGGDCFHCHSPPLFMATRYFSNGLDSISSDPGRGGHTGDPFELGTFKTPSLRNIELTAPYMHDGRFQTLDEVLEFYLNQVQNSPNLDEGGMHALKDSVYLSPEQRQDLIAFLKTLTDNNFINNSEYSNPF